MCRRFCSVVILALGFSCTLTCVACAATADPKTVEDEPTPIESRILAITNVVLQKHIDPPTRQQMILTGIKALYRADKQPTPKGLSRDISELATTDQITEYLHNIRAEFSVLDDAETILTRGMLEAIPGRSFLIDASADKVQGQLAANRYVGIGIALSMSKEEKLPAISKVFYNGPAWNAGVKTNDVIDEIDGESTASKNLKETVEQLRGEAGSELTMVVRQPDSNEPRTLTITRGRVFIPTVEGHRQISPGEWEYTIESASDIALIRIKKIGPSTLHELRQVETKLRGEDIRGIVLDLRSGGGLLHDLVMVADSLLDGGMIGHVRSLDEVKTYEARPGTLFRNLPMAVLIAKVAATDRVFLTAALQDQGRAIVVGERTNGETYVNSLVPIPGRDEKIRLAVAVAHRGDGTPLLARPGKSSGLVRIQATKKPTREKRLPNFIEPDFRVPFKLHATGEVTSGPQQSNDDPMLAKAIEVLRGTKAQAQSGPQQDSVSG